MPSVMGRDPLGALYLTSLHALGAYVGALNLAVNLNGDLLDVRTEGAVAYAMRVARCYDQQQVPYRRSRILWTFLINSIYFVF